VALAFLFSVPPFSMKDSDEILLGGFWLVFGCESKELNIEFKNFYIDGYEGSIDTIYYEGTDPTIVITHTFYNEDGDKIKLYYYHFLIKDF
jgi:hypothetical protein